MNIILSNFFNNYTYNKELINNFSLSPYTQIKGVHGSFPFSFFSTGVNENIRSEVCVYPDMEGCIKNYGTLEMIILNYDDPCVDPKDYHNNYLKVQFESFASFSNVFFSIGDLDFLNYIISTYPEAKILITDNIFSKENFDDLIKISNIKGLISSNVKSLDNCPWEYKIFTTKIYSCLYCNYFKDCEKLDLQAKKEFSLKSSFLDCSHLKLVAWDPIKEILNDPISKGYYILFDEAKQNVEEYYTYLLENLEKGEEYGNN